jgi:uncharacterized protein (TIGR04562 family)
VSHSQADTPPWLHDEFQWDALKVVLEGTSSLELPRMAVATREAAYSFLGHYGLDLRREDDRELMARIHQEAISFVRRHFLSERGGRGLPPEVLEPLDLADLLVQASGPPPNPITRWSCALLRVMHTIHHANRAFRRDSLDEIRRQIFEPYRAVIHVDELGCPVLLHDKARVQLEGVFFKEEKTRDSIIMKLLHKPNNVAQDIYDWIGLQFVTRTVVEALMVVRFLVANNLVVFSNVVPGRSINNLLDLTAFRERFTELAHSHQGAGLPPGASSEGVHEGERWMLEHLADAARSLDKRAPSTHNPFSASEYRSIQFTCRQLIRVPNPARRPLDVVTAYLHEHGLLETHAALIGELEQQPLERELTFFFPYEIQILDYANYLKTRAGQSSHVAYKKRQTQAARRRVLQGLS